MSTERVAAISEAPENAAFHGSLAGFFAKLKELAQGGFTLAELGYLFLQLLHLAMGQAAKLTLDGPAKKALVLQAVGQLFDLVAPVIPLPPWLAFARRTVLPGLRQVALALADGMIEVIWLKFLASTAAESSGQASPPNEAAPAASPVP